MEHFRLNNLGGFFLVAGAGQLAALLDTAHQAMQVGIDLVSLAGGGILLYLQIKKLFKPNEAI